jgi:hypothetical protein
MSCSDRDDREGDFTSLSHTKKRESRYLSKGFSLLNMNSYSYSAIDQSFPLSTMPSTSQANTNHTSHTAKIKQSSLFHTSLRIASIFPMMPF